MKSDELQRANVSLIRWKSEMIGRTFSSRRASLPSSNFRASLHFLLCAANSSLRSLRTPCGWKPAWYGIRLGERAPPPRAPASPAACCSCSCATGPFSGERARSGVPGEKGDWLAETLEKGNVEGGGVGRALVPGGGGDAGVLPRGLVGPGGGVACCLAANAPCPPAAPDPGAPDKPLSCAGRVGCGARRPCPALSDPSVRLAGRTIPLEVRDGVVPPRGDGTCGGGDTALEPGSCSAEMLEALRFGVYGT